MKDYRVVEYKGNEYCVYRYKRQDGTSKLFIIDEQDLNKVLGIGHSLYQVNGYVGYSQMINRKLDQYYLHNIIMDKQLGGGKGQKYTIDHISRNKHDNRKVNLRLISQSSQNENQKRRKRKFELPKDCGIKYEDIPKCVYYAKPRGGHGERFTIELSKEGQKRKRWDSSSSKKISLKDKLIEIKQKLLNISKEYPELIEEKNIIENYSDDYIRLRKEFNRIIKLSGYKCVDDNLVKIPKKKILEVDINEASDETKEYLKLEKKGTGRVHRNNLPKDCGITPDMIPKYCYYQAETEKRGDAFVMDRHPNLPKEQRQWKTTGSKQVSTKNKFKQLKNKLKELNKSKNESGSKTAKPTKKKIKIKSGSKTNKKIIEV